MLTYILKAPTSWCHHAFCRHASTCFGMLCSFSLVCWCWESIISNQTFLITVALYLQPFPLCSFIMHSSFLSLFLFSFITMSPMCRTLFLYGVGNTWILLWSQGSFTCYYQKRYGMDLWSKQHYTYFQLGSFCKTKKAEEANEAWG